MKRIVLFLCCSMTLLLAACASSPPPAKAPDESNRVPVNLTIPDELKDYYLR